MGPLDYRSSSLFEDGIVKGMGVSILVHAVAVLLGLGATWLMPPRRADPPLCTVSLLTIRDLGGGEEGALSKGNPEPVPAGEARTTPPPPEPEPVKETVPLVPVPKKVERRIVKPKPKPKAVPEPSQKQQAVPETPPAVEDNSPGTSNSAPSGHGEGIGRENAGGSGLGASGEGPGSGAGGGSGPYTAAFGSGDGPRFADQVMPRYPRIARELAREGTVLLLVTIDERGRLVNAEVLKRAGSGFDEEALRAVKNSTFHPAKRNGKPISCRAHLPIHFRLTETE